MKIPVKMGLTNRCEEKQKINKFPDPEVTLLNWYNETSVMIISQNYPLPF